MPLLSFSQGQGNVWMMSEFGLDFNSGSPVIVESAAFESEYIEGTATICNAEGGLLFYTDGDDVFNRDNEIMPDGNNIAPVFSYSSTQSSVIVPVPQSDSLYYIFSLGHDWSYYGWAKLYYNVVDMSLDGGMGDVITDPEYSDFLADNLAEKITVVGNCSNIWIVVFDRSNQHFLSFPVLESGIGEPVISDFSYLGLSTTSFLGEIKISNDATKLAMVSQELVLFDFSIETGLLSEPKIFDGVYPSYSVCFSPDDTKLYTSSAFRLIQFDLSLPTLDEIVESEVTITSSIYSVGSLKKGPDDKVYLYSWVGDISVIHSPNLTGDFCDYEDGIFDLETIGAYAGNFPNEVVTLTFGNPEIPTISSIDTTICPAMTLSGREGGYYFEWNDGSTGSHLTIDTSGTYYVITSKTCATYVDTFHVEVGEVHAPVISLPDTTLCEKATSIRLSATIDSGTATTYHWEPVSAIISGGDDSVVWVNPMEASVFYLTATNHSGICDRSATDSLTISFFNNTVAIVSPNDTTICSGDDITIVGSLPAGHTAHWSPEASVHNPHVSATVFSGDESTAVVFTSSMGHCAASDTLNITVQPTPVVNVGNDTMICDYDRIKLNPNIVPESFPGYEFSWSSADLVDDAAIRNPVFSSTADSGFLKLTVATSAGCKGSDSLYWKVRTSDFMMLSSDTGMCPPVAISLLAENASSYLWMPADGLSSDTVSSPIAYPVATTNYLVMGTSSFGCVDSQYVLVEVYPEASVYLQDSAIIYPGESFQINPEGNAVYYSWFPPSGLSASNIANPIASPEVRTRYFYTASTEMGCWLKDSIDILVSTESVMDMPNAFVPGNGTNNIFKLSMRGIAKLNSFTVFNRWGNKVFYTKNIAEGWDGTFNGTPQPMGVYMYIIDAVSNTGKPFVKQGNVTLIR